MLSGIHDDGDKDKDGFRNGVSFISELSVESEEIITVWTSGPMYQQRLLVS